MSIKIKNQVNSSKSTTKLQPVLDMNLTEGQEEGLTKMLEWIKNKDRVFTLTGSAGTGKTTIVKEFIKQCGIPKGKIVVSAPTHKAKKVIAKATDLKAETLQSLLGLRPNTELANFNINNPQFDVLADEKISMYELVGIDECSMVNKNLYNYLIETAGRFNVKILFIGDHMQLPPVKEILSQTFKLNKENQFKLTQIVRQADDNPLLDLLTILRKDIKFNTMNFLKVLENSQRQLNTKDEGYVVLRNKKYFQEYLVSEFKSDSFIENKDYIKYTAWTNKNINGWNVFIRNQIHNTPKSRVVLGDLFTAYKTVMDSFNNPIITNSEDYVVTKVVDYKTSRFINVWRVALVSTSSGRKSIVNIVKPDAYDDFLTVHNNLLSTANNYRGHHWGKYYKFKGEHLLLDTIEQGRELVVKKDLDYGYGVTVHKTQGSTYDYIAINGINICKMFNNIEMRKSWYVALSRASKKCIILM